MAFTVIDKQTGHYPDCWEIALKEEWAKNLCYCDIEGFAIEEDGTLVLLDECGKVAYCPEGRFRIIPEPQWIPVTERLPKADERDSRGFAVPYLVMNGWRRVTARYEDGLWVLFGEGLVLKYVTHWMELPEPPKECE